MATTVEVAELTVTVTESYTLNGVNYGNTTNQLFADNGKVLQRIMVASISDPAILNFGTDDAEGQVVKGDFVYFRVTNLDNANFVTFNAFADITQIKADADTAACSIEFFAVTV